MGTALIFFFHNLNAPPTKF